MNQRFLEKYGPWAVVTGASSGIGKAFAIETASRGVNVCICSRRKPELEELAKQLTEFGVQVQVTAADLSQSDGVKRLHDTASDLDVGLFVAAAGFGTSGTFVDNASEDELNMIDVNCRALTASTHHFAERLKRRGNGGIILLSSIVAFQGNAYSANYSATKAFVQTLAEGLHRELKPFSVDVLASAPGPTNSGFADRAKMKLGKALSPAIVAQRSLDALGKKSTVLPGALSKALKHAMFGLPRWAKTSIMSNVMKGMTRHQHETNG